jgi:hypothetical protein
VVGLSLAAVAVIGLCGCATASKTPGAGTNPAASKDTTALVVGEWTPRTPVRAPVSGTSTRDGISSLVFESNGELRAAPIGARRSVWLGFWKTTAPGTLRFELRGPPSAKDPTATYRVDGTDGTLTLTFTSGVPWLDSTKVIFNRRN